MQPFDGRTLAQTLEQGRAAGWPALPAAISAFIVAEALKAHLGSGREISRETVLLGFEGGVTLAESASPADGVAGARELLAALAPAELEGLLAQGWSSPGALREALDGWRERVAPGVGAEVLRELMGNLFDGALLQSGRLFLSNPGARARLVALRGDGAGGPPAVVAPPPPPAPPRRGRWVLALAAAGIAVSAVTALSVGVRLTQPPEVAAVTVEPDDLPKSAGGPPPGAIEVVTEGYRPSSPGVAFDAEAAPLTVRLTSAHQTVVPRVHCFDVERKTTVQLARRPRAMGTVPRGDGSTSHGRFGRQPTYPTLGGDRVLPLLGLLSMRGGAPLLLDLGAASTMTEAGKLCMFAPTDRSLEQENTAAGVLLGRAPATLRKALHVVEPDHRFRVRSFVPNKSWTVRVSDTSRPWPVMFVTQRSGAETVHVLNRPAIGLTDVTSVWITVPVHDAGEYAREVSIQLAEGQRLVESAEDLLADGRRRLARGDPGSAVRTLDQCINAYPTSAGCHHALGDAFWALGYRDEARTQYREFLRLGAEDDEAAVVRRRLEEKSR